LGWEEGDDVFWEKLGLENRKMKSKIARTVARGDNIFVRLSP
jgi:hypothetical protein